MVAQTFYHKGVWGWSKRVSLKKIVFLIDNLFFFPLKNDVYVHHRKRRDNTNVRKFTFTLTVIKILWDGGVEMVEKITLDQVMPMIEVGTQYTNKHKSAV